MGTEFRRLVMKKSVRDVDVAAKRVLLRCDLNVPVQDGVITDDTRIVESLPTIRFLMGQGAKVILCSHRGRPKGAPSPDLSLAPVAARLSELLRCPVPMAQDCIGPAAEELSGALQPGQLCLLENVRFHPEEEQNDPAFARALASLADLYVNDAFGTAHRAHASTAGVADYLPAYCGFLIEKELYIMGGIMESPASPFAVVLGGNKISDKIKFLENLIDKADLLLIGGGMAFTFIRALGGNIGNSLCEQERLDFAMELLNLAKRKRVDIHLPVDVLCGRSPEDSLGQLFPADDIPEGLMGLDIGPKTIEVYAGLLEQARTILWNGPMGVFENPTFSLGTAAVAEAMALSSAVSVVGGGDTAGAVSRMGFSSRITHVSTGGGAALEFLEGRELPGIACLQNA
ncbi:MAG: phosphoglycerate kinase [Clostridiales bacterium]|nr:phosphoglycerate kinase [Clostridiales bacterium]